MDTITAKKIARQQLIAKDPSLASVFAMQDLQDALKNIKGDKGDKGDKGEPGKDGLDGLPGEDGLDGKNGIDGKDGKDGINGRDGIDGEDGKDGVNGKEGSPDSPEDIAYKLNMLEGELDYKVLKNVPDYSKNFKEINDKITNQPAKGKLDQRWHGGGITSVSHDATLTGNGTPANPLSVVSATSGIDILSTTTGINAKTVATTTLYTVPAGKTAYITSIDIIVTAATAVTVPPTAGVGIAAGESDIFNQTSLIGLTTTGKLYRGVPLGVFVAGNAADIIKLGISVGATATTMTLTVNLIGYLV